MSFLSVKAITEQIAALHTRAEAITDIAAEDKRELTAEEQAEYDSIHGKGDDTGKIGALEEKLVQAKRVEARQQQLATGRKLSPSGGVHTFEDERPAFKVPESAKRGVAKLRAFTTWEDAYVSGQFMLAVGYGNKNSWSWLDDHGFGIQAALRTDNNESAGYLLPTPLEAAIIRNIEGMGVFRREVGMQKPMVGGAWNGPRRTSGLTVYYPGEGNAPTVSADIKFDLISLKAKDAVALTAFTKNVNADAVVSIGEMVAWELAYAHANAEDQNAFNGDGTSTYGGITGLKNRVAAGSVVTAAAGDDTFAELEMAFYQSACGQLPDYPGIQPKWYVSKQQFWNSMSPLQIAGGGNNVADLGNGPVLQFLGYPVVFVPVLPRVTTTLAETIVGFFGDLTYSSAMGTAGGMMLETSNELYFRERMIAVMGWQRYDINHYDIGTSTAAGSIIGLKMGTA